jgi:SAM-dependent methyltransferase
MWPGSADAVETRVEAMSGQPVTVRYARFRRALRTRGAVGTARQALSHARTYRARREWAHLDGAFDVRHGVDTTGIVPLESLKIDSANKELGIRYQPSNPEGFRALMGTIEEPLDELTFVDLGAGKGRTLLLASELPFVRVVGVEFSSELCEVARRNVAAYPASAARNGSVDVVCADAAQWPIPESPLLLYVYNAFEAPLLASVLVGIHRSWEQQPRTVLVALVNRTIPKADLTRLGFRLVSGGAHGEVYAPC